MVRLSPKFDFALIAKIPAVADDTVLARRLSGQVGRLRRTGDRRNLRLDANLPTSAAPAAEIWRMGADQSVGEANNIDDNCFLHGLSLCFEPMS